jgi:hypothetical protein
VTAAFVDLQRPSAQPIERPAASACSSRGVEHRASAVDQQRSQIGIALLADSPEPSSLARGVLARGQAKPAREVPAGGEALNVNDARTHGGGSERSDPWDLQQSLHHRILFVEPGKFALNVPASLLERVDLAEHFEKARVQQGRHCCVGISDRCAHALQGARDTDGNGDAELPKRTA